MNALKGRDMHTHTQPLLDLPILSTPQTSAARTRDKPHYSNEVKALLHHHPSFHFASPSRVPSQRF